MRLAPNVMALFLFFGISRKYSWNQCWKLQCDAYYLKIQCTVTNLESSVSIPPYETSTQFFFQIWSEESNLVEDIHQQITDFQIPVSCNAYLADVTEDPKLLTMRSGIFSAFQMLASVIGAFSAAGLGTAVSFYCYSI